MRPRRLASPRPAPAVSQQYFCVVLHDVAPAHWDRCTRLLRHLRQRADAAGVTLPLTLLVVPQWHGDATTPAHYLRWLQRLHRLGHELALHGFTHRDEGPPAAGLLQRLLRERYTEGEGEFAALPRDAAAARLTQARQWAQRLGLEMPGFVAPAWLLGEDSRAAVADSGFTHTCTLTRIIALPRGQALRAPSLVFSTRTAWRRLLSLAWNTQLAWWARRSPLLRFELHPQDVDHPVVLRSLTRLLDQALRTRAPLRLAEAAALAAAPG